MKRRNARLNKAFLLMLSGLLACVSTVQAAEITESVIREKVVQHVLECLKPVIPAESQSQVTVNVLHVPNAPFVFPTVEKSEQIKMNLESSLGEVYSSRSVVRVQLSTNDGAARAFGVPVEVQIRKPVWVAKNIINAGQPLKPSDFDLKVQNVSQSYAYTVGSERNLKQYVARVNLRPGETLDSRKIVIPPDVRYNDEVRIFLKTTTGMTVSVPGIAMGNARIGDTVRVRQSRFQRKYYTAKVINKNQVLVEM